MVGQSQLSERYSTGCSGAGFIWESSVLQYNNKKQNLYTHRIGVRWERVLSSGECSMSPKTVQIMSCGSDHVFVVYNEEIKREIMSFGSFIMNNRQRERYREYTYVAVGVMKD